MLSDACRSEATIGGVRRGEAALAYRSWCRGAEVQAMLIVDTTAFSWRYTHHYAEHRLHVCHGATCAGIHKTEGFFHLPSHTSAQPSPARRLAARNSQARDSAPRIVWTRL